jgi:hypothetical protein
MRSEEIEFIRKWIKSNKVYSEGEVAKLIFYREGVGEVGFMLEIGVRPRFIFELMKTLGSRELMDNINVLVRLLSSWEVIDLDLREDVADLFCDLIVRIEDGEQKDRIRENLQKCFLDQQFEDAWGRL